MVLGVFSKVLLGGCLQYELCKLTPMSLTFRFEDMPVWVWVARVLARAWLGRG